MKKLVVVLLISSSQAFAYDFSISDVLGFGKKTNKQLTKELSCTNFTGKWEGVCTTREGNNIQSSQSNIEIEMTDCGFLQIDKSGYAIGGMKTEALSGRDFSSSHSLFLKWEDETQKNKLLLSMMGQSSINYPSTQANSTFAAEGSIYIENERLYTVQTMKSDQRNYNFNCEYSKR